MGWPKPWTEQQRKEALARLVQLADMDEARRKGKGFPGPGECLLIVAGNAVEAMEWARRRGMDPRRILTPTYGRPDMLRGLSWEKTRVAYVGNWRSRGDLFRLREFLQATTIKEWKPED